MRSILLVALAFALVLSGSTGLAQSSPDIDLLLQELGANASTDLTRDLQAEDLFPASGIHRGVPVWNTGSEMPQGGSLAFVYPTAARAGIELRRLHGLGVQFTTTPTVERIMRVTDFWQQLVAQSWFGSLTNSLDAAVREIAAQQSIPPNQSVVNQAMGAYPDMAARTAVDETTGFSTLAPYFEVGPKPGEIWCYDVMYGSYDAPGVWCCSGEGDNCWVERPCPM